MNLCFHKILFVQDTQVNKLIKNIKILEQIITEQTLKVSLVSGHIHYCSLIQPL